MLEFKEKLDFLAMAGTHLTIRRDGKYTVVLYHLNGYFAELYYNSQKGEAEHVRTFRNSTGLEPYLDLIELEAV